MTSGAMTARTPDEITAWLKGVRYRRLKADYESVRAELSGGPQPNQSNES
jgi:hypothetical protein